MSLLAFIAWIYTVSVCAAVLLLLSRPEAQSGIDAETPGKLKRLKDKNDFLRSELGKAREALEKLGKGNRSPDVLAVAREALRSIDESGLLKDAEAGK
jgi:hypothetical protein